MVSLTQTMPAMPVRDMPAAVSSSRDRFGFEIVHHDGGLHPVSIERVDDADFGTREFATLDLDGNLVTSFEWRSE